MNSIISLIFKLNCRTRFECLHLEGVLMGKWDDMEVQEPEMKRKKREVGLEGGSYQQYKRMQESV